MSIRRIRLYPDPILRAKARKVRRIDDDIRNLGADMIETLLAADGVGLAAPQVGVLKRVIALDLPEEVPYWLVNPEILEASGTREVTEGCLSVPGYEGLVTRSVTVKARALDAEGGKWRVTAEELLAQVLEHEIDHLNGIMYMDHLAAHERLREVAEEEDEDALVPHMHDVRYKIRADHSDGAELSIEQAEPLIAVADLSHVSGGHSLSELRYDVADGNADGHSHPEAHDSHGPAPSSGRA